MKKKVIVTDLTRFSTPDKVCVATIDIDTGKCMRPIPYLTSKKCKELNLQPGAILKGTIKINDHPKKPHVEDATYKNLKFHGPCTSEEFKEVLEQSISSSISQGFGYDFGSGEKHIPFDVRVNCSIITIRVESDYIEIHEDQYKPGKIKLTFTDGDYHQYSYIAITDRGFYDYAMKHQTDDKLEDVQEFISSQEDIFLRVGLSRRYKVPGGRDGYWLQVNGIYTFPDYQHEIRSY